MKNLAFVLNTCENGIIKKRSKNSEENSKLLYLRNEEKEMKEKHYCFNTNHDMEMWGRIHVPLARKCSLYCIYCNYQFNKNISEIEGRPGVASKIIEGEREIANYLNEKFIEYPGAKVVGVSGPGDPFENIQQLNILVDILKNNYPQCILCICTNGRIYDKEIEKLLSQDILQYITLTINTLDVRKYSDIYKLYQHNHMKENMLENQLKIIRKCQREKIKVKINTVYLEGINNKEIIDMFTFLREEGVQCFNLIPCISNDNKVNRYKEGYEKTLNELISKGFPLLRRCKHCRSDYCECGLKYIQ